MRRLLPALTLLAALAAAAGCASRAEAPACRGGAFPINATEPAR